MGGSARQRAHRWLHWRPSTYWQAWLYAIVSWGLTWFVIWSLVGVRSYWLARGLTAAVAVTVIAGLTESYKLRRRRRRQADLEAVRAAQVWRPYNER